MNTTSISERISEQRAKARAASIARYAELVGKLAGDGSLKAGELVALDETLVSLGITTATLDRDIEAVKKSRDAEAQIDAGEKARSQMPELQAAINKFNDRRQKLLDDLDRDATPLNSRGTLLSRQLATGEAARITLGEIKADHPLAFGVDPNLIGGTRLTEEEQIASHADDDKKRIANFLAASVRDAGDSGAWHLLSPAEFELLKFAVEAGWIARPIPAPPTEHKYVQPLRIVESRLRLEAKQVALAAHDYLPGETFEERVERAETEIRRGRIKATEEIMGTVAEHQP